MSTDVGPRVSEVAPQEAWEKLSTSSNAVLVDVRTRAEWGYVGVPDISEFGQEAILVEWASFPDMSVNPLFLDQLVEELDGAVPSEIFFLCRSGARSMKAAHAVAEAFAAKGKPVSCINVAEGFEGDLDPQKHRGGLNGWKARGLPWRQS